MPNDDSLAKTILSSWLAGVGRTGLSKTLGAVSGVAAPPATAKKTTAEINDVFIMLFQLYPRVASLHSVTKGCYYIQGGSAARSAIQQ